jgi:hypothetical protein
MAHKQERSRTSPRRETAFAARHHPRQHPIGILGVLRAGDDSWSRLPLWTVPSRGRLSGWLQAPRAALCAVRSASMHRTPGAGRGRGDHSRGPTAQRARRQKIVRLSCPQVVLPDWNLVAPLRQRLPIVLRFREGQTRDAAPRLDAQTQPPVGVAPNGESVPARSLARLAARGQHAGGVVLLSAIVISALRVAALTDAYVF